jgi:hypothetical protein
MDNWGDDTKVTLTGWQGAAQHTYTPECAGHHAPGPCPPPKVPLQEADFTGGGTLQLNLSATTESAGSAD